MAIAQCNCSLSCAKPIAEGICQRQPSWAEICSNALRKPKFVPMLAAMRCLAFLQASTGSKGWQSLM